MEKFISKIGNKSVQIAPASFIEATELRKAIEKALLENGIDIEKVMDADIVTMLFSIDSSDAVRECLFKCLKKSLYDGIKIDLNLFDDVPEARCDYMEIMEVCIKLNVYPFIKYLLSKFGITDTTPEVAKEEVHHSV